MKPLIIVGIDPGTTLAYAILDLDGNLIRVSSSKQMDINSLTASIFYLGKPLIVATDVNPVPKFVEKFAAQTGSKVIGPEQNLKVEHKKEITKGYYFANDHEQDALAAAILAFKKIRALLDKVSFYLKRCNKEDLKREVVQLVFSKGLSISDAIASLEKKEVKPQVRKPKIRTIPIKVKFDEARYLREQNERLKSEIRILESNIKKQNFNFERVSEKKVKDIIGFREKKISFLNKGIMGYKAEVENLKKKVSLLNDMMLNLDRFLVVPRFKNLSLDDVRKDELKDVIFVEDPNVFSEKTLEFLKGEVSVIIFSKPVSKAISRMFILINIKNLEIAMEEKFILVEKSKFEEEKNKVDLLTKVVKEYEEERAG